MAIVQFRTTSMSVMLAITKHGVCVGIIAPCSANFIMVDMETVQNCISAGFHPPPTPINPNVSACDHV